MASIQSIATSSIKSRAVLVVDAKVPRMKLRRLTIYALKGEREKGENNDLKYGYERERIIIVNFLKLKQLKSSRKFSSNFHGSTHHGISVFIGFVDLS